MNQKQAMEMMDQFQTFAETLSGAKAQLLREGWSDEAAEQIIITVLSKG